jgi:hypothetical protein
MTLGFFYGITSFIYIFIVSMHKSVLQKDQAEIQIRGNRAHTLCNSLVSSRRNCE